MTRGIERALKLSAGDLGRGLPLFFYLYLIITSFVMGKVARDAMFLARFQAVKLPYADIATAILVGFVIAGYVRIGRVTSIRNLLIGSSLFFSSNCFLAWLLAGAGHFEWLYPIFYVWVGIFGVLAPAQVWTLANYVLTTREARRLFGIVGSGAIAGWISAGFFSKTLVRAFGSDSLLLVIGCCLLLSAALIYYIWRSAGGRVLDSAQLPDGQQPRNLRESMSIVWSSAYMRSLAFVICLSSLVTTIVGWQFKAIAKEYFSRQDALAIFFGDFNFYAGLLSLAVQLLLTPWILRRFGMGPALFVVPVALLGGSVGLLASGTLVMAILLKGGDQVLRYSIDKSTVELLYLPLPARIKFQVKWFIDTVIWRFGDALAGVIVLILATYLHVATRQISWAVAALLFCWMIAVFLAKRTYLTTLVNSIREHRLGLERTAALLLDRDTTQVLLNKLSGSDEADILCALAVFEADRSRVPHPAIRGLVDHPSAVVRCKALTILAAADDVAMLPKIELLLKDPDLDVRTEALLFLCHHKHIDPLECIEQLGDFADFSICAAMAAYLAHPGESQNLVAAHKILEAMVNDPSKRTRFEAARLLGRLPDAFGPLLATLLADQDADIACEAIRSTAALHDRRHVTELLDRLAERETCDVAVTALASFGNSIIGALRDHLLDENVPLQVRWQIPGVLAAIGTEDAVRLLESVLMESDTTLRYRTLTALNKAIRHHPGLRPDPEMTETVLLAEILGHYRSYQIVHVMSDDLDDNIARALHVSMDGERERIFRLLSLLFPSHDFESAYVGLQSENLVVHDNALEFLEDVLKPEMRQMLVPLLDSQVTIGERAERAASLLRVALESPEQAVEVLVGSDDPWLRSCGTYAIGRLGLDSFEAYLNRCLDDPDPLLRQAAREAKLRVMKEPTR